MTQRAPNSLFKFLNWTDVQDMMNEGVLSMEEVRRSEG